MEDSFSSEIAINCLHVWYCPSRHQSTPILADLNLRLGVNKIYGLVGPSGCGKTTLQRCIWGYLKPSQGSIETLGQTPGAKGSTIPGRNIGYMPQDTCLEGLLSIKETLTLFGKCFNMKKPEIQEKVKELLPIINVPDLNTRIDDLSLGQKRRVSFACTIIHGPKLLILDEPSVGSDPVIRKVMWKHLEYLRTHRNTTIFLTTHYIDELLGADVIGIMEKGYIIGESNPVAMVSRYQAKSLEEAVYQFSQDIRNNQSHQTSNSHEIPSISSTSKMHPSSDSKAHRPSIKSMYYRTILVMKKRMPLILLIVLLTHIMVNKCFGDFFGETPQGIKIGYLSEDAGQNYTNAFLDGLPTDIVTLVPVQSYQEARLAVEHKSIEGFLVFPDEFTEKFNTYVSCNFKSTRNCSKPSGQLITYVGDTGNRFLSDTLGHFFTQTLQDLTANVSLKENGVSKLFQYFQVESVFKFGGTDYFREAKFAVRWRILIHLALTACVYIGIPYIIREIRSGIMERLQSMGLTKFQVVSPMVFALTIVNIVYNVIVLFVTIAISSYSINSDLWTPILLSITLSIGGTLIGFIVAYVTKNETGSLLIYVCYTIGGVFVTGCIWPVESLPYFAEPLYHAFPSSYAGNAVVDTMVKGLSTLESRSFWNALGMTLLHSIIYLVIFCLVPK